MNFFIIVTILIFFTAAKADKFTFGQDIKKLEMCIEHHLSRDPYLKLGEIAKSISKIIAKRFHSKTYERLQFNKAIGKIHYYIKTRKSDLFVNNNVPEDLGHGIKNALTNCIERKNLPGFVFEPQVLTDILDFFLVDWPTPLYEMIKTQNGRSALRLYAYSAGVRLMSALRYFSMDYNVFHHELQRIWLSRAQQYYDGRNIEFTYIRHRFTTNEDRIYSSIPLADIHTIDDITDFTNYNPWRLNQVCDDSRNILTECIEYFRAEAENYLIAHIDQCYRIIFYILELQSKGIITDEDDIYNGPIPSDVLPSSTQLIIWSIDAYQKYLLFWSGKLENLSMEFFDGCFSRGTKEDLIIMLTLFIAQKTARAVPSTTTSTTTDNTFTSTESLWYKEGLKKGGVRKRDCGKHFLLNKRFKTAHPKPDQQPKKIDKKVNYFGIVYKEDPDQLMSLEESQSMLSKIITELNLVHQKM